MSQQNQTPDRQKAPYDAAMVNAPLHVTHMGDDPQADRGHFCMGTDRDNAGSVVPLFRFDNYRTSDLAPMVPHTKEEDQSWQELMKLNRTE